MLNDETIVTFAEAARRLPRFNGHGVSPASVWRWARVGVRGVKLEAVLLGGRWITSLEAVSDLAGNSPRAPKNHASSGLRRLRIQNTGPRSSKKPPSLGPKLASMRPVFNEEVI